MNEPQIRPQIHPRIHSHIQRDTDMGRWMAPAAQSDHERARWAMGWKQGLTSDLKREPNSPEPRVDYPSGAKTRDSERGSWAQEPGRAGSGRESPAGFRAARRNPVAGGRAAGLARLVSQTVSQMLAGRRCCATRSRLSGPYGRPFASPLAGLARAAGSDQLLAGRQLPT